jgi:rifampicin phosphotransferase
MTAPSMPVPTPIPLPADFPVEWPSPEQAMQLWTWDQMHMPYPFSPLGSDLVKYAEPGFTAGFRASGVPIKHFMMRRFNTFIYQSMVPDFELIPVAEQRTRAAVQERGMTMYQRWATEYLPEVEAGNHRLEHFDYANASDAELKAHIDWALENFARMWEIHFLLLPGFMVGQVWKDACARLLGLDPLDAYEMMQGGHNLSVESGSKLWQLAHGAPAAVKDIINTLSSAEALTKLHESDAGRAFLADLDGYLKVYGWRKGNFDVIGPSWVEEPSLAIDQVRLMLRVQIDPAEEQRRGAERAEARANECRAKLADDPAKLGEFSALLAAARNYPPLQENHNFYIDQKAVALARLPFLEIGRRMAAQGLLDAPEDFAYLQLDELFAFLAGDRIGRSLIARARKDEMAYWQTKVPPPAIGAQPPGEGGNPLGDFEGAPVERSTDPKVVNGLAASRGVVTGTARVLRSLADSARIQEGDILVCDMTTPAWTPLFASLGAIVADSGGPLSHCAVVAREYGVPCVTGTRIGTRVIPDGARITVDGSKGIVRIER